jgi:plasmid stability protein
MQPKRKSTAKPDAESTVSLTVKNLPRPLVERLKARAVRSHRSLQGEVRSILEEAAALRLDGQLTPLEVLQRARRRGLRTESSVAFIRALRDGR